MAINAPHMFAAAQPDAFDGTTSFSSYLEHFNACARINEWPDNAKKDWLFVSLKGAARLQYEAVRNEIGHAATFQHTADALLAKFEPPEQKAVHEANLLSRFRKSSETINQFYACLEKLCALAHPNANAETLSSFVKYHFLHNLTPEKLARKVRASAPASVQEAVQKAIHHEAVLAAEELRTSASSVAQASVEREVKVLAAKMQDLQQCQEQFQATVVNQLSARSTNLRYNWRPAATNTFSRNNGTSFQRLCYTCNQPGHLSRDSHVSRDSIRTSLPALRRVRPSTRRMRK